MMKLQNSDKQLIENIAWQCVFKGGRAVKQARAIVWSYNPGVIFNEEDYCNDGAYFRQTTPTKNNIVVNLHLVPNPTKDVTTLYYNFDAQSNAIAYIVDGTGRIIFKKTLDANKNNQTFDLSSFTSGMYTINVVVNETNIANLKLCIIK